MSPHRVVPQALELAFALVFFALLLLLPSAALVGCDDDTSPEQACDMDCGEHGSCVVAVGRETCACDEGYQGEGCSDCAAGYVESGGLCVDDPCEPNPCTAASQGICVQAGEGYSCACSEGAQDNDGDGVCRPDCAAAVEGRGPQACDDSSGDAIFTGGRVCEVVVEYTPEESIAGAVYIRGEFNNWESTHEMVLVGDTYQTVFSLSPGSYAYKLYLQGSDTWMEDPGNPYHSWSDGTRNSRLIVPDCNQPYLRLTHVPEVNGDAITIDVQYVDGASLAGLNGSIVASRDGSSVSGSFDANTNLLTIQDSGLSEGKYNYRFQATDNLGNTTNLLYVPVWIEAEPFAWEDSVLYFALTDRFADGDSSNNMPVDGVDYKANWQGGDFAGLIDVIESGYFDEMGVNTLWISSISQNTGGAGWGDDGIAYSAYHSYWPISTGWTATNPMEGVVAVDPHFGTLEEFKTLVDAAHARGIRVLVDFVANHVHQDSPLWTHHMNDSAWFHVPTEVCQSINWDRPITCWFADYLPDMNYSNAEVIDTVTAHAVWMVQETGIDGFRLDAVKHMIDDFSLAIRARLDEALRDTGVRFYMVGETYTAEDGYDLLAHYVSPEMLDGQFDFPLYWVITKVFFRNEADLVNLKQMTDWNDGAYGEWAVMSNFLGNHDVCRSLSHANGDIGDLWCNGGKTQGWENPPGTPTDDAPYAKLRLAWTFLFTSPGVPLIYYGDEFGMEGAGDPDNRKFMRFSGSLNGPQENTLAHVQKLGKMRAAHRAVRYGERITLANSSQNWVYAMQEGEDLVIVVINRGEGAYNAEIDLTEFGLDLADVGFTEVLSEASHQADGWTLSVSVDGLSSAVLVPSN